MSAAVLPPPVAVDWEKPKRFTRDEYQWMVDSEVFAGQRFELVDGELIDKMGQNPPHASAIRRLLKILSQVYSLDLVLVQSPVEVSSADRKENYPEPDLAVMAAAKIEYDERHPFGDELLLAVEVADSSLLRDMTTKRDVYARAGVPEYWVVDLNARRIIVHRNPGCGAYTKILTFSESQSIELNGHAVAVAQLLP